jgi:hypothetical protein
MTTALALLAFFSLAPLAWAVAPWIIYKVLS